MNAHYRELVERISKSYGLSVEEIERQVGVRRALLPSLLSKSAAARIVAAQMRIEYVLGASHVSGPKIADAVAAAIAEANRGHLSTLGYWSHPHETPPVIASHYIRAIDAIVESGLDSSISIKVDKFEFDRDVVLQVLRHGILRRVRVHFDAESHHCVDRTFSLLEEGLALGADVAASLPSRWERSSQDAERLVRLGVAFRIIKGQGKDPEKPQIDPRRSFLDLVRQVSGRASHVAIATHDRRVAEPALDMLRATQTSCSLEQLRSLPRLDFLAEERGIPVRIYVAYGRPGLPYTLNHVTRRSAIIGWVLRDLIVRRRPANRQPIGGSE